MPWHSLHDVPSTDWMKLYADNSWTLPITYHVIMKFNVMKWTMEGWHGKVTLWAKNNLQLSTTMMTFNSEDDTEDKPLYLKWHARIYWCNEPFCTAWERSDEHTTTILHYTGQKSSTRNTQKHKLNTKSSVTDFFPMISDILYDYYIIRVYINKL